MKRVPAALLLVAFGAIAYAQSPGPAPRPPKAQALSLYKAFQQRDWQSLYGLIQYAPKNMAFLQVGPEKFAAAIVKSMKDGGTEANFVKLTDALSNLAVGEPEVKGD